MVGSPGVSIFVSVAAYRDPELVPTVLNCLDTAERPDDLRIVVNWQHLGDEDVSPLRGDPRVEIIEFDARESRGACWARAQIMRRYADADWFLQIDSHTRFAPGWDRRLIAAAKRTEAPKPIISCYPQTYDPATGALGGGDPTQIVLGRWNDDGLPVFDQQFVPGWRDRWAPARARFIAAGFLFAPGSFPHEVPYDDSLYFHGEEITLSVRAFTWGYDLFHPAEVLSWHYYIRQEGPRHWTDHNGADGGKAWHAWDRASRRRVTVLLHYPSIGRFRMGPYRTVAQYEAYTGLSFTGRSAIEQTMRGDEPPLPPAVGAVTAWTGPVLAELTGLPPEVWTSAAAP